MKLLLIAAVALCAGCSVSVNMDDKQIEWAESVCRNNGGVKIVVVFELFTPNAYCKNGAIFKAINSDLAAIKNI